jgi:excisionase family DNA binding protein
MAMIGTSEAARRLGISARRVAAMIEQGVLPAQKIGKTWVIDETDIAKLAKKERRPGRPFKK